VVYHSSPSNGDTLKGATPLDARRASRPARAALAPLSIYKAFLRELPRPKKIRRGGVVRALRREYRADALWQLMAGGPDVRVRIKVDPDDISTVWVYTLDGREIGPATSKPVLPGIIDPADKQTIEQLREEQRRHARQVKEAKAASVARRDMSRWLSAPPAPINETVFLPEPAKQLNPASRPASRPASPPLEPEAEIDPGLVDELDTALRQQTTDRLKDHRPIVDDNDIAVLAGIEKEQSLSTTDW